VSDPSCTPSGYVQTALPTCDPVRQWGRYGSDSLFGFASNALFGLLYIPALLLNSRYIAYLRLYTQTQTKNLDYPNKAKAIEKGLYPRSEDPGFYALSHNRTKLTGCNTIAT